MGWRRRGKGWAGVGWREVCGCGRRGEGVGGDAMEWERDGEGEGRGWDDVIGTIGAVCMKHQ